MRKQYMYRITIATIFVSLILCMGVLTTACTPKTPIEGNAQNNSASPLPDSQATPEPISLGSFTIVIPDKEKYLEGVDNNLIKLHIINSIVEDRGVQLDINIIPLNYSDYFTQISTLVSSGQKIEAIIDKFSMFDTYAGIENLSVPLDNMLLEYGNNLLSNIDPQRWSEVTHNNNILAIPSASLSESTAMYVRKDVLKMMSLQDIKTREEFEAILGAFSVFIPDGITPLAMNWTQALDYMSYLHYIPSTDYWLEPDGYVMREQTYYYHDFLDMMKKFYSRKYIPEDFFDISEEQVRTMFTSGLSMMYITEYTNIADDYKTLLETQPTAEVELVKKPTYRRMTVPRLSAETSIDDICIFTSYGQNHSALMVYLDWLIADVENYETARIGIMGTHVNFNNLNHEYEYLGQYAEADQKPYNALYSLDFLHSAIYSQIAPTNGNPINMKSELLQRISYEHLSTALTQVELVYPLSAEAQSAMYYYRLAMDETTRRYIKSEITYIQFKQFLNDNKGNADIVLNEINALAAQSNP
ncbi:MAG: hypothetical protein KAQ68_09500 [Clostridiales bacterium]|nr:hypothetical protein [Clostridiales bacterium]